MTPAGAAAEYILHEKYELDEVVTDVLPNRKQFIIVKAKRMSREEEDFNIDLPAFFIFCLDDDPRPDVYSRRDPTKSYYKDSYEDSERLYKNASPCGNAIYWFDVLDRSSKEQPYSTGDPEDHSNLPVLDAATSWPFQGRWHDEQV